MEIDDLPIRYQKQAKEKYESLIHRGKPDKRLIPQEEVKNSHTERKTGKYGNIKTEVDGVIYDSKGESKRAEELIALEKLGIISNLRMQVPYELIPKQKDGDGKTVRAVTYKADFVYVENGETIVEDFKASKKFQDPVYKLKKKLMLFRHGITIKETYK